MVCFLACCRCLVFFLHVFLLPSCRKISKVLKYFHGTSILYRLLIFITKHFSRRNSIIIMLTNFISFFMTYNVHKKTYTENILIDTCLLSHRSFPVNDSLGKQYDFMPIMHKHYVIPIVVKCVAECHM